jgi:glyoxylase I family protein
MKHYFTGIDHAGLAAENVDKLADWYCDVLGFEKLFRDEKGIWIVVAPDKTMIEIMPIDDTPRPKRTICTPGWSHYVLRVNDIEKASDYLKNKGVTFSNDIIDAIGGGKVRNFYDPEGNMLQIAWRPDDIF